LALKFFSDRIFRAPLKERTLILVLRSSAVPLTTKSFCTSLCDAASSEMKDWSAYSLSSGGHFSEEKNSTKLALNLEAVGAASGTILSMELKKQSPSYGTFDCNSSPLSATHSNKS
jgi:hypothetical protein